MFSKPLFVYGSLMFPYNLLRIIGRIPLTQGGAIYGYKRLEIKNDLYPTIVKAEKLSLVTGKLIYGLTKSEAEKIEDYEGELYERRTLTCRTFSGEELCWTYQLKPEFISLITQQDWSLKRYANSINK